MEEPTADPPTKKHSPARRIVSGVISLLIVGGIFVFAIPKVADYSAVWKAFESLTGWSCSP